MAINALVARRLESRYPLLPFQPKCGTPFQNINFKKKKSTIIRKYNENCKKKLPYVGFFKKNSSRQSQKACLSDFFAFLTQKANKMALISRVFFCPWLKNVTSTQSSQPFGQKRPLLKALNVS
jgi:hypothetical protein